MKNTPSQQGYILVTTLWVIALLTLLASFFALWTQRAMTLAQTKQRDLQSEIAMFNTQSNLLYLLNTQRFTIAGLTIPSSDVGLKLPKKEEEEKSRAPVDNRSLPHPLFSMLLPDESEVSILPVGGEIAFDDRAYWGDGNVRFAIQDEGGLLNINLETEPTLRRLLDVLGVAEEQQDPLVAKLKDYIDADDLHRLNGAEKHHYEKQDKLPPRNRYLLSPLEVWQVLDWAEQSRLWENGQLQQVIRDRLSARPNFNTAPALVLQAAYGFTPEAAERVIKQRQNRPFYQLSPVTEVAGAVPTVDPEEENFFPSTLMRITYWTQENQRLRQVHLRLTSFADGKKPWQIQRTLEMGILPRYKDAIPISTQTDLFDTAHPPAPD